MRRFSKSLTLFLFYEEWRDRALYLAIFYAPTLRQGISAFFSPNLRLGLSAFLGSNYYGMDSPLRKEVNNNDDALLSLMRIPPHCYYTRIR